MLELPGPEAPSEMSLIPLALGPHAQWDLRAGPQVFFRVAGGTLYHWASAEAGPTGHEGFALTLSEGGEPSEAVAQL